jgi:L,D-transpeptidase ErfK/SrfK
MSFSKSALLIFGCILNSACVFLQPDAALDETLVESEPPPSVVVVIEPQAPIDLRQLESMPADASIVGSLQWISAYHEDTLPDIARQHGLGFDEMIQANPGVDPWLPGEGTRVLLPTRMILPSQREGLVLNVASRRLFHFDEQGVLQDTFAIGVGREGWATPTGQAKVRAKAKDPVWFVPASIRAEHAEAGDPLPRRVGPGPDNPLGGYAIALDMPGYLIHGTNKPYGVGMRVSHGCVRLYPEDIESLFPRVPVGAPVTILNEPISVAEVDGQLYLEAHPPFEDDQTWQGHWEEVQGRLLQDPRVASREIDWEKARAIIEAAMGIPLPISVNSLDVQAALEQVNVVRHTRPVPEELVDELPAEAPLLAEPQAAQ